MKRWSDLERERPELAKAGADLIYQYGVGLGYLATVRSDGAPRLHPVCPTLAAGGLYLLIGNHSPKLGDLRRDGRYALHAFPVQGSDDEFCVSGRAVPEPDPEVRRSVHEVYTATGAKSIDDTLFECLIDRALHAKYTVPWSWPPTYAKWRG